MLKSLITGGAGFIGSHVADILIRNGHGVAIVDDLSAGDKKNINPKAKFYKMDIQDPGISEVFQKEKPDLVFHLAAQIDVRGSIEDPVADAKINILGSLNIFENSVKYNVKKVIFASSGGAVYGEADTLPTPEGYDGQPLSPYGVNKLSVEKILFYYKKVKNLDYIILRLSNVYGPRQNSKGEAGVVAIFISKLLKREQAVINGDGHQTRDFVYVKDVARAFVLAGEKNRADKFNISTGREISVNQIFDKIILKMKADMVKKYGPAKKGEQMRSCLDNKKAREELGWSPEYDLEQGIAETVEWFKLNT